MAYPIHDWRDPSKYPSNPLTGAPAAFIEERQKWGQSEDEMCSAVWLWEFLRRHEQYQAHWEDDSDEYYSAFGIVGMPRPDPKTDFPIDLLFNYEHFNKHLRYPTFIDVQKSWSENETRLKQQYSFLRASKSSFDLTMASFHAPERKLIETRERQLGIEKYPTFLRVLDALAAKETLTQIAEVIGSSPHYNTAARWRKSALDLQAAFTGLPRMKKSDI